MMDRVTKLSMMWLVLLGLIIPFAYAQSLDEAKKLNQEVVRFYHQGRYKEAVPFAKRTLEICKSLFGKENPNTATSYNNLALLYKKLGDYSKAESLLK
ncbi:MAG TPA: tetratricopeptide repeat protein, partial [Candidatus Desulfofervidus auxilii]|nr:tetratricopeptide repeat protein [Candidatus Desulfofervidus auxilii]